MDRNDLCYQVKSKIKFSSFPLVKLDYTQLHPIHKICEEQFYHKSTEHWITLLHPEAETITPTIHNFIISHAPPSIHWANAEKRVGEYRNFESDAKNSLSSIATRSSSTRLAPPPLFLRLVKHALNHCHPCIITRSMVGRLCRDLVYPVHSRDETF